MKKDYKKMPFLHTLTLSMQHIKKEKRHITQKQLIKQFDILHKEMHTSLRTSIFSTQGLQITVLQQHYSPRYSKNPDFRGVQENNFKNNPNFSLKKIVIDLVIRLLNLLLFENI